MAKKRNDDNPYIKLGRIKMNIAKQAHLSSSDVYISQNNLRHITNKHNEELLKLGISALTLVKIIVREFNQIREGNHQSYWLILWNEEYPRAAAMQLNYSLKNKFWEIKTAIPMRIAEISKKKLIWTKSEPPR